MKTILVDDEPWAMEEFREACAGMPEIELCGEFLFAEDALAYARENLVEFALLDIEMHGMNGIELAKALRVLYPEIIIVFVSSHSQYLRDFIDMKADYFVLKPYTRQDVQDALMRAVFFSGRLKKRMSVHTFGSFAVFVDGRPMAFRSSKAKELFALLVQKRGGEVTPREAVSCLWEDRDAGDGNTSAYRVTVMRLKRSLEDAGFPDLLRTASHGYGRSIDADRLDCDLYDFLDGDPKARHSFNGQYLNEYSWGESMLASLIWMRDGWK